MVVNAVFEGGERPFSRDVIDRAYAPSQGRTKKKGKSLLRWRNKRWQRDPMSRSNQVSIIDKDSDDHVELSMKKFETSRTTPSCMSLTVNQANRNLNIVSPLNDQDDYSVYIVHNYVEGEITENGKEVEASLCGSTASGQRLFDESSKQYSSVLQTVTSHIPNVVRAYISFDRSTKKVNPSLFDDDTSAISTDNIVMFRDSEGENFSEDDLSSVATQAVGTGCAIPKQRMIENMTSVKFAHSAARGCAMKLRDDDISYVTVDTVEWEREFGRHGCCFAQQIHGIVMETGDAVYDLVGEPEDYPFGEHLVSVVMQFRNVK